MRQYLYGGLTVLAVLVALLALALTQHSTRVDSPACRSNAAEISLQVEYLVVVRPFIGLSENALDGYIRTSRLARQLMAERIALDCATDYAACDTELRDVLTLKVSPRDAELAECVRLTGNGDLVGEDDTGQPSGYGGYAPVTEQ